MSDEQKERGEYVREAPEWASATGPYCGVRSSAGEACWWPEGHDENVYIAHRRYDGTWFPNPAGPGWSRKVAVGAVDVRDVAAAGEDLPGITHEQMVAAQVAQRVEQLEQSDRTCRWLLDGLVQAGLMPLEDLSPDLGPLPSDANAITRVQRLLYGLAAAYQQHGVDEVTLGRAGRDELVSRANAQRIRLGWGWATLATGAGTSSVAWEIDPCAADLLAVERWVLHAERAGQSRAAPTVPPEPPDGKVKASFRPPEAFFEAAAKVGGQVETVEQMYASGLTGAQYTVSNTGPPLPEVELDEYPVIKDGPVVVEPTAVLKSVTIGAHLAALAAEELDLSAEALSRDVCNDWSFPASWSDVQRKNLIRAYHEFNGDPDNIEADIAAERPPPDFGVHAFLAFVLRGGVH